MVALGGEGSTLRAHLLKNGEHGGGPILWSKVHGEGGVGGAHPPTMLAAEE